MIGSKGWEWNMEFEDKESVWKNPALESYGIMNRWGSQGKKVFLDLGCGLGRYSILFFSGAMVLKFLVLILVRMVLTLQGSEQNRKASSLTT